MNKKSNKANEETYKINLISIICKLGETVSPSPNKTKIHVINPNSILAFEQNYLKMEHQSLRELARINKVSVGCISDFKNTYIELRNKNLLSQQEIKDYLWENKIEYPVKKESTQEQRSNLTDTIKSYENTIQQLTDGIKSNTQTMKESNQLVNNLHLSLFNQTNEFNNLKELYHQQTNELSQAKELLNKQIQQLTNIKNQISADLTKVIKENLLDNNSEIQRLREENDYLLKLSSNPIEALSYIEDLLNIIKEVCNAAQDNEDNPSNYLYDCKRYDLVHRFFNHIYYNHAVILRNIEWLEESSEVIKVKLEVYDNKHLSWTSNQMKESTNTI